MAACWPKLVTKDVKLRENHAEGKEKKVRPWIDGESVGRYQQNQVAAMQVARAAEIPQEFTQTGIVQLEWLIVRYQTQ